LPVGWIIDDEANDVPVGAIGCVEGLPSKLECNAFGDAKITEECGVEVENSGADDGVAAKIAKRAGGCGAQGPGVEEARHGLLVCGQVRIGGLPIASCDIGVDDDSPRAAADAGRVSLPVHREGKAAAR